MPVTVFRYVAHRCLAASDDHCRRRTVHSSRVITVCIPTEEIIYPSFFSTICCSMLITNNIPCSRKPCWECCDSKSSILFQVFSTDYKTPKLLCHAKRVTRWDSDRGTFSSVELSFRHVDLLVLIFKGRQ